ncbi:hypothetical protein E3P99_04012, partial [Wallemia hederae]
MFCTTSYSDTPDKAEDVERKKRTEWFYQFNLAAAKCSSSPTTHLKAVIEAARRNHDTDVHLLALAELARSLAQGGDWKGCSTCIKELEKMMSYVPFENDAAAPQSNPDAMDEDATAPSFRKEHGSERYVLFIYLVVRSILSGRSTEAALANACLKEAKLLADDDSQQCVFEMVINGCTNTPTSKTPKHKQLHDKDEAEHWKSTEGKEGTIYTNAELALRCSATQVHIMRREMEDARGQLSEMVTLARKSKTIKAWVPWLLMLEGFLLQASNEEEAARKYYEAVAMLCGRDADTFNKLFQATSSTAYDLQNDELAVAAQTATMVLDAVLNKADIEAVKVLVERTKRVQCSPQIHALLKMVEGRLSKGTITRSKHILTLSLTLSSKSQDNCIRAFLFALLHEVFSHSHEDQALQMIQTGYAISRKMGKVD